MTKRAFTLVELLVVVGIIAAMATVSIGSYFSVVRGMADRGALAAATSVISLAQERARIDMTPTVVYLVNEVVQNQDTKKGTDLVVAGTAIAVRRAGHLTRTAGGLLGDEFADFDRTYGFVDGMVRGETMRLYRFNFNEMQYSSVYSEAVEDSIPNEKYFVEKPVDRNFRLVTGDGEDPNEIVSFALRVADKGNANWQVGDAYGFEFAKIRLPDNYIFGSQVPSAAQPVVPVKPVIRCYPDSDSTSLETVDVYGRRPDGWRKIGSTKSEMKDI